MCCLRNLYINATPTSTVKDERPHTQFALKRSSLVAS
jgi:hypothetical protein